MISLGTTRPRHMHDLCQWRLTHVKFHSKDFLTPSIETTYDESADGHATKVCRTLHVNMTLSSILKSQHVSAMPKRIAHRETRAGRVSSCRARRSFLLIVDPCRQ